jgi:hypothetical protein
MQRRHLKILTLKSFPFYGITLDENILDSDHLKGLSYEIDFENVDENLQILALTRAAAGF